MNDVKVGGYTVSHSEAQMIEEPADKEPLALGQQVLQLWL